MLLGLSTRGVTVILHLSTCAPHPTLRNWWDESRIMTAQGTTLSSSKERHEAASCLFKMLNLVATTLSNLKISAVFFWLAFLHLQKSTKQSIGGLPLQVFVVRPY